MAQIIATSPPALSSEAMQWLPKHPRRQMSENNPAHDDPKQSSSESRLTKAAGVIGVFGLPFSLLTLGVEMQWYVRAALGGFALSGIAVYLYAERRPIRRLARRLNEMFSGASKWDVAFDLFRILGILMIFCVPFFLHGVLIVDSWGGRFFLAGLALFLSHPIYQFFRAPGLWDREYKMRKSMSATAVNYASASLEDSNYSTYINRIEINALLCIKSYVEYSVTDRDKANFNVNLIVKHPSSPETFVCVQRSNPGKLVPKEYPFEKMQNAVRAFESGKPRYLSRFRSKYGKPYLMVWLVPISDREEGEVIGLLAIDSLKPGHLDLEDGRESLSFNILPYVALLRFTLTLRRLHGIWN